MLTIVSITKYEMLWSRKNDIHSAGVLMRYSLPVETGSKDAALLKLLALGDRDIEAGRTKPARTIIGRLRAKYVRAC